MKYIPEDASGVLSFVTNNLSELLFFLNGTYYQWSFRLLRVEHKNTFFRQEEATNYRNVGWFVLFSWICKALLLLRSLKSSSESKGLFCCFLSSNKYV